MGNQKIYMETYINKFGIEHYRKLVYKSRTKQYNEDPNFKLRIILSTRLSNILTKNKINKNNSIIKIIGCSLEQLKNYIEQQ